MTPSIRFLYTSACKSGNDDLLLHLLEMQNCKDDWMFHPGAKELQFACAKGFTNSVLLFLALEGESAIDVSADDWKAFKVAVKQRRAGVVKALMTIGRHPDDEDWCVARESRMQPLLENGAQTRRSKSTSSRLDSRKTRKAAGTPRIRTGGQIGSEDMALRNKRPLHCIPPRRVYEQVARYAELRLPPYDHWLRRVENCTKRCKAILRFRMAWKHRQAFISEWIALCHCCRLGSAPLLSR